MAAVGFLQTMCRKTKLCKYYAHGRCTRRQNCDFAHSMEELRAVPDLSRTKVCPMLIRAGRCDDSSCTFAHDKGELRKVRLAGAGRIMDPNCMQGARPLAKKTAPMVPEASPEFGEAVPPWSLDSDEPRDSSWHDAVLTSPSLSADAEIGCPTFGRQTGQEEGLTWQYSSSSEFNEAIVDTSSNPGYAEVGQGSSRRERQSKVDLEAGHKPPPGWDWGSKFHKTALCAFHRQGKCTKGAACHFAHGEEELKPLPDLFRTKLCMRLLSTGTCSDPTCRYAHSREELRCGQLECGRVEQGADALSQASSGLPVQGAVCNEAEEQPAAADHSSPMSEDIDIRVSIKNTFLTVEDEEPPSLPPKAKTQPDLARVQGTARPEDVTGICTPPASFRKQKSWPLDEASALHFEVVSGTSTDSLCIKNTFLTFEELPALGLPPKARTQPDLAGSKDDEDEEDAESDSEHEDVVPKPSHNSAVPPEELSEKVPSSRAQGLPEVGLEIPEVLVKNTFLTIEEPRDLLLPSKAKSSPEMSKLLGDLDEEEEQEGAATEGGAAPASSAEDPTSPAPSWGSSARRLKESTVLDSVDLLLGLPEGVTATIESEQVATVPVCAIQQVHQLVEDPEMVVQDFSFALPVRKKVLLKPGALAAQGKAAIK